MPATRHRSRNCPSIFCARAAQSRCSLDMPCPFYLQLYALYGMSWIWPLQTSSPSYSHLHLLEKLSGRLQIFFSHHHVNQIPTLFKPCPTSTWKPAVGTGGCGLPVWFFLFLATAHPPFANYYIVHLFGGGLGLGSKMEREARGPRRAFLTVELGPDILAFSRAEV